MIAYSGEVFKVSATAEQTGLSDMTFIEYGFDGVLIGTPYALTEGTTAGLYHGEFTPGTAGHSMIEIVSPTDPSPHEDAMYIEAIEHSDTDIHGAGFDQNSHSVKEISTILSSIQSGQPGRYGFLNS